MSRRFNNHLQIAMFVAALLLALFVAESAIAFRFEGPFPDHDYPFPVKDSGVEVRIDADIVVEWLDEERMIFSALAPGEPRMQGYLSGSQKKYPGRVVVWDTASGNVNDLGEGQLWCSHNGRFTLWFNDAAQQTWLKKGVLDDYKVVEGWREGNPPRYQDMHTCQLYDGPRKKVAHPDHLVFNLREQDGFLDVGSRKVALADRKEPVQLIRPDGTRSELPLLPIDTGYGVWWEEWAGVYLLDQYLGNGLGRPSKPDRVPLLHPDGTLEGIEIPLNYSRRNEAKGIALTRRGLLVGSSRALMDNAPGESGLYLIQGEKVARLIDWHVGNRNSHFMGTHRGIAISPSGCKVAFKHGKGALSKYRSPYTIKMINVCTGE